jgi:dihydrolipoamide dehydrogenase
VVIGAGAIGLEMGSVWSRLGSKVTVLEYLDRILPGMDAEISAEARKSLEKQGFPSSSARASRARRRRASCAWSSCRAVRPIECDRVLLAVGRRANTQGWAARSVGIRLDERGRIPVDEHFATSAPNVYAIGDVIRGPMLAHKASEEGVACVERIVTGYGHVDYDAIPNVVYTAPEIARWARPRRSCSRPASSTARAPSRSSPTVARAPSARPKGASRSWRTHRRTASSAPHPRRARRRPDRGARHRDRLRRLSEDVARACHAHPTLPEVIKEAALAVDKRQLHL